MTCAGCGLDVRPVWEQDVYENIRETSRVQCPSCGLIWSGTMDDNNLPKDCAVGFDLDGTLWQVGHRLDWNNPATMAGHCRVKPKVAQRIRRLHAAGVRLVAITGRRADMHADVTSLQMREALGPLADEIPVLMSRDLAHTPIGLLRHKLAALQDLRMLGWRFACYVGDTDADRTSAVAAGVRFVHVEDFESGHHVFFDGEPLVCAETPFAPSTLMEQGRESCTVDGSFSGDDEVSA